MDHASELPLAAFGLPMRNNTSGHDESDFYIPGTLVKVTVDPTHPVAYGMPGEITGFFDESQAFVLGRTRSRWETWMDQQPPAPDGVKVVGSYASKDLLRSGWLLGERFVAGRAAIVEASIDKGRVVLLGFRVQHRGQAHGTFKLLFNSLYLGASERTPAATAAGR